MEKKEIYEEISNQAKVIIDILKIIDKSIKENLQLLDKEDFENMPTDSINQLEVEINRMVNLKFLEKLKIEEKIFRNLVLELKKIK